MRVTVKLHTSVSLSILRKVRPISEGVLPTLMITPHKTKHKGILEQTPRRENQQKKTSKDKQIH